MTSETACVQTFDRCVYHSFSLLVSVWASAGHLMMILELPGEAEVESGFPKVRAT